MQFEVQRKVLLHYKVLLRASENAQAVTLLAIRESVLYVCVSSTEIPATTLMSTCCVHVNHLEHSRVLLISSSHVA